jgi:CHASE1-domain containing sensor protein
MIFGTEFWFGVLAAVVHLLVIGMVVVAVVHRHEAREEAKDAERHAENRDTLENLKKLTMNAISQRLDLERQVHSHELRIGHLEKKEAGL